MGYLGDMQPYILVFGVVLSKRVNFVPKAVLIWLGERNISVLTDIDALFRVTTLCILIHACIYKDIYIYIYIKSNPYIL